MRHSKTIADSAPRSTSFEKLAALPYRELEREMLRGQAPGREVLAGWEFRGLNCPSTTRVLGIRKFVKGFFERHGELWGYNCPVLQNRDSEEWIPQPSADTPRRFGFYKVCDVEPTATDNCYLHAVLLDYGLGQNPKWDPTRGLRDYLVQVDDDVMLGVAYYALGRRRIRLPSYFILGRFRPGLPALAAIR